MIYVNNGHDTAEENAIRAWCCSVSYVYGAVTLIDRFFHILTRFLTMLFYLEKPVISCCLDSCFTRNCWLVLRVMWRGQWPTFGCQKCNGMGCIRFKPLSLPVMLALTALVFLHIPAALAASEGTDASVATSATQNFLTVVFSWQGPLRLFWDWVYQMLQNWLLLWTGTLGSWYWQRLFHL